jgi:Fe-S oxidoreductase
LMSCKKSALSLTLPRQKHFMHKLEKIAQECKQCDLCIKQCAFLQRYGNPGKIAATFDFQAGIFLNIPFECSLCELCSMVCPAGLNPSKIFLEMRREIVYLYDHDFSRHKALLDYEKRGISKRYAYYGLPKKCDTIFFPGCTLSGTRPKQIFRLFNYLKEHFSEIGIVLDCCSKPSHDLGRNNSFKENFGKMKHYLEEQGIKKILVACPGCFKIFKRYGGSIQVETVYEIMNQKGLADSKNVSGSVCIHDPCAARHGVNIHTAIRRLIMSKGLDVSEMEHSGKNTICCGEGGAVGFIDRQLSGNWTCLRAKEARGKLIITYCAGCYEILSKTGSVCHIIDLIFEPQAAISGRIKIYRAPMTYLNRIFLKRRLQKAVAAAVG